MRNRCAIFLSQYFLVFATEFFSRSVCVFMVAFSSFFTRSLRSYLVNTGSCEPITLKRANNSPNVVKNSTNKRFFASDVQVPDGIVKVLPLTTHRRKCATFRIEIYVDMKQLSSSQTAQQEPNVIYSNRKRPSSNDRDVNSLNRKPRKRKNISC